MEVVLVFFLMALFIALSIPIGFALGVTSLVFLVLITDVPLVVVVQRLYMGLDSFTLLAVPGFMFAGMLMNSGGISKRIVDFATALVGHLKGGLAAVNIVASMFFAGVSGTSMADTAAIGGVLIPSMIDKGYKNDFAAAVTASSSTIGIIIPPSVPMILYGVFVGMSVSNLFIAGLIPGILIGLGEILVAIFLSKKYNYGSEHNFSLKRVFETLIKALPALVLPFIIIGGIMGGIFTPTEAAGIAVIYAFLVSLLIYKSLTVKSFLDSVKQTTILSGSVMLILSVSKLLGWVFSYAQIPQLLVNPVLTLTNNPIVFMWLVAFVLILAGTFMHGTAMLVVIVPLFLPIVEKMGINPFQFAMVVMMSWGIGQQTPPVGSALFVSCSIANVDFMEITKANLPFMSVLVFVLALIIHVPQLVVYPLLTMLGLI